MHYGGTSMLGRLKAESPEGVCPATLTRIPQLDRSLRRYTDAEGVSGARIRHPAVEPGVMSNGVRNLDVGDDEQMSPVGRHDRQQGALWSAPEYGIITVRDEIAETLGETGVAACQRLQEKRS